MSFFMRILLGEQGDDFDITVFMTNIIKVSRVLDKVAYLVSPIALFHDICDGVDLQNRSIHICAILFG